ncbi:hypothetical protein JHK86_022835 [Glycine max]|nr:hypothetical protein JHK86_022835 [Glycine max]
MHAIFLAMHSLVCTMLNKTFPDDGLLPIYINNPHSGAACYSPNTFGAVGDRY